MHVDKTCRVCRGLTHAELQHEQNPAESPGEGPATATAAVQVLHIASSTLHSSCRQQTNAAVNLSPSEHLTCHLGTATFSLSSKRNVETHSVFGFCCRLLVKELRIKHLLLREHRSAEGDVPLRCDVFMRHYSTEKRTHTDTYTFILFYFCLKSIH